VLNSYWMVVVLCYLVSVVIESGRISSMRMSSSWNYIVDAAGCPADDADLCGLLAFYYCVAWFIFHVVY